ncbi:MAG: UDP-N-acetylmuramate--L-alanine ligase [Bdellovibrio sp.]|nr:UDP-N-acetylmuramate--L-alanine ligase [Bdellovibrio sp.]
MKKLHLHFVGIGGIGMSGIAEVFLNQGFPVSGSDLSESETTRRLSELGATIQIGHAASNVGAAQVVVMSSAVRANNPEILEAKKKRIPIIPRAEMLGELMRGKTGIAIAGSHGKTTTTSIMGTILTHANLDPTLVIGGKVDSLGGNAKLGQGKYVLAEADESDGSFLHLPTTFAVITNIDNDHLDHFGNQESIDRAFIDFVGKLPFYGLALVCGEDAGVKRVLERLSKPFLTYGWSKEFDYHAQEITPTAFGSTFEVYNREKNLGQFEVRVPGRHNVLNALAAVSLSLEMGIPLEKVREGLREFSGVKRRFEVRYRDEERKILLVDDYGHHPTEVKATLKAARSVWKGRIVTVFQPHRYTRTQHCFEDFTHSFEDTDVLYVSEIYSANEDPIPGVSSDALVSAIQKTKRAPKHVFSSGSLNGFETKLAQEVRSGDLILCLGAGSITQLPAKLLPFLSKSKG